MNQLSMILSAALAAVAGLASLPAAAQARPALVQSVDDPARVPYQEGHVRVCQVPGNCAFVFSAVPGGKRRVIEQVSCHVRIPAGTVDYVHVGSSASRPERSFVPFVRPNGGDDFIAHSSTLLFYNAGESPRIDIYHTGSDVAFYCTLTGREVAVP